LCAGSTRSKALNRGDVTLPKARSGKRELLPGIAGFAVPGLLAEPSQEDGYQPGRDFQEDMRRRRAALRGEKVGPVVYQDEERTF
jgi:hypothetical protein